MLALVKRQMLSGRIVLPASLILHIAAAPAVMGQTAEERGRAIVEAAYSNDSGYQDMMAQFTMVTRATNGRERTWEMRIMVLAVPGDGDRTIVVFDGPPRFAGHGVVDGRAPLAGGSVALSPNRPPSKAHRRRKYD